MFIIVPGLIHVTVAIQSCNSSSFDQRGNKFVQIKWIDIRYLKILENNEFENYRCMCSKVIHYNVL